jgi:hypothetical protein
MNGTRALRVVAFMSISVGVGILSRGAWGFVIFGILVLIDNFVIKSPACAAGFDAGEGDDRELASLRRYEATLLPAAAIRAAVRGRCHGGRDRMGSGGSGAAWWLLKGRKHRARQDRAKTMPIETSKSLDSSEA